MGYILPNEPFGCTLRCKQTDSRSCGPQGCPREYRVLSSHPGLWGLVHPDLLGAPRRGHFLNTAGHFLEDTMCPYLQTPKPRGLHLLS